MKLLTTFIAAAAVLTGLVLSGTSPTGTGSDENTPDPAVASVAPVTIPGVAPDSETEATSENRDAVIIKLAGTVTGVSEALLRIVEESEGNPITIAVPRSATVFRNGRKTVLIRLVPGDLAYVDAVKTSPLPTATTVRATGIEDTDPPVDVE